MDVVVRTTLSKSEIAVSLFPRVLYRGPNLESEIALRALINLGTLTAQKKGTRTKLKCKRDRNIKSYRIYAKFSYSDKLLIHIVIEQIPVVFLTESRKWIVS